MATPNLPPGFDFTDPDTYAHRLPVQEFAEPFGGMNSPSIKGASATAATGW
jgi:hypothetical protein